NLFRVELPQTGAGDLKHVRVGTIEIAAMTDKTGPAILAVPPTDILVSREPLASSARNAFRGRVTRLARQRHGAVPVTADARVEPAGARRHARPGHDRAARRAQPQWRVAGVRGRPAPRHR